MCDDFCHLAAKMEDWADCQSNFGWIVKLSDALWDCTYWPVLIRKTSRCTFIWGALFIYDLTWFVIFNSAWAYGCTLAADTLKLMLLHKNPDQTTNTDNRLTTFHLSRSWTVWLIALFFLSEPFLSEIPTQETR